MSDTPRAVDPDDAQPAATGADPTPTPLDSATPPPPSAPPTSAADAAIATSFVAPAAPAPHDPFAAAQSAPAPAPAPASQPTPAPHYVSGSGATPAESIPPAFVAAATPKTAREPRRLGSVGLVAAVAVAALVGGGIGTGATLLILGQQQTAAVTQDNAQGVITINDTDNVNLISAIAAKATPSVVTISASSSSAAGTGSGVILSADGYVVTNNHVVTLDGAAGDATITATGSDGTIYQAEIVGTDPILDLAVIKLSGATNLAPIEFADSDALNVGDETVVIGAPLGLANSVTSGIVSALNRSITVASSEVPEESQEQAPEQEQEQDNAPYDFWQFGDGDGEPDAPSTSTSSIVSLPVIQTDASINPGNSGGALLDSEGKLIGVNVAIATAGGTGSSSTAGSIGLGFAIPSNLVQRVTDEIIATGSATHGLLGAMVYDSTIDEGATVAGAAIENVTEDGAAEAAGLQAGDVVTSFNGVPITGSTDLTAQVRTLAGGAEAELSYVRDGRTATLTVTLGSL